MLENRAQPDDWADAYAEFFGQRFVYTQRIVWHNNWKYVFSPGGIDELYNLAEDPHERINLTYNSEYRDILIGMVKRMLILADSVPGMWKAIVNLRCICVPPGKWAAESAASALRSDKWANSKCAVW